MKCSVLLAVTAGWVALAVAVPALSGPADGLVAWYPLNGNANDASTNGYNGVLLGNVSWVPAVSLQGLQFDGSSTRIVVPNFIIQPRNRFSAAFWARPDIDAGTGFPRDFLSKHNNIGDMAFVIRTEADGKYDSEWSIDENYYDLTGQADQIGLVEPNFTNFDFITATYDGSAIRYYVNGILEKEQPASGNIGSCSYPLTIGAYAAAPTTEMFKGVMDDIRIYNRALSADEVLQLYTLGLPRLNTTWQDGQLVFSWPTNFPALALFSATNLGPAAVWTSVSNVPVVVDSRFCVTNLPSDPSRFFRLQLQ